MKYILFVIVALLNLIFHIIRYVLRFLFSFKYNWGGYIASYYYGCQTAKHFNHQDTHKANNYYILSEETFFETVIRWCEGDYY